MTLKVVCPRTKVLPEVVAALDASGYPWTPVDVSSDDAAYHRLLCDLAATGEGFALVEHDIVIAPHILAEFDACPSAWCVAGYSYIGGGIYAGLGCCRFRAGVITPAIMAEVGEMHDETHPPAHWCRQDAWLQTAIRAHSPHRHDGGVVEHVRPDGGIVRPTHAPCATYYQP